MAVRLRRNIRRCDGKNYAAYYLHYFANAGGTTADDSDVKEGKQKKKCRERLNRYINIYRGLFSYLLCVYTRIY